MTLKFFSSLNGLAGGVTRMFTINQGEAATRPDQAMVTVLSASGARAHEVFDTSRSTSRNAGTIW
jgi:hypothetical protein